MADKARVLLKQAQTESEATSYLSELHRALVAAVFSRAGILREATTYDEAADILNKTGCPENTVAQTLDMLKRLDAYRYDGTTGDHMDKRQLVDQTRQLVRRVIA